MAQKNKEIEFMYCWDCEHYYDSSEDHLKSFETSELLKEKVGGHMRVRDFGRPNESEKNETDDEIRDRLIKSHNRSYRRIDLLDIINNLNSALKDLAEEMNRI